MIDPSSQVDIPTIVRTIFADAANQRASDVHIDPGSTEVGIRFRVDGGLIMYTTLPMIYHEQVMAHIKVLADLSTTAVFTPQDGHFALNFNYQDDITGTVDLTTIDLRVSVFPTIYGDAAVFRLANSINHVLSLEKLGMDDKILQKAREVARKNNGMLLIAGPVGSGKTSVIYSTLFEVLTPARKAVSLEDPVEFHYDEVRQIQMNPDRGLTFASSMKSILRQDPDIIMIGEIRDAETAEYAMRAALVGRVVFSTIHSNSGIGTIARLLDMKIEKSVIAYALNGVISTRLIKKNCEGCKEVYVPDKEYLDFFGITAEGRTFYKGKGCAACGGRGYLGRTGIFEIVELDTSMRSMIVEGASMSDLQKYITGNGVISLKQAALLKVFAGVSTLEEIISVI